MISYSNEINQRLYCFLVSQGATLIFCRYLALTDLDNLRAPSVVDIL
jgi:hypothetical protein